MTDELLRECLSDILAPPFARDDGPVIALPTSRAMRAILPVARRTEAARVLRAHYGGGGMRRRAMTASLSLLVKFGIAAHLPLWQPPSIGTPDERVFHAWAHEALGEPHHVTLVLVGPKRANRKPVVLIADEAGQLIGVAKVGYNDVTKPLVAHEASALGELAPMMDGRVHVPSLIDARRIGTLEAMMMRPLTALDRRATVSREALTDTVRLVSGVTHGERVDLTHMLAHPRMHPLEKAVAGISRRTAEVPFGSAHGDLHPGNLGVASDGQPVLWDWERWMHGVPVGFDLLHHDLQTAIAIDQIDPGLAAWRLIQSAGEVLAPLGIAAAAAPDVARDYLVRLAARYVEDAQDEAGSRLGSVETWLFPAVLAELPDKERT